MIPNPWMTDELRVMLGGDVTEDKLMKVIIDNGWTPEWLPFVFGQPHRLKLSRPVDAYVTRTITASGWDSLQAVTEAAWTVSCTMYGVNP